jgi:type I restriction enzyme, S subunit
VTGTPEQKRLKYLLDLNDSGVWGDEPAGVDDVVVLRSTDIALDGRWAIDEPAVRSIPGPERAVKTLRADDLVVVKSSGSQAHLGKTARVSAEVALSRPCFANFVQRLRPKASADSRYLWYLLNSSYASAQLEMLGTTTTGLRNLNGEILGSVVCPDFSLRTQSAIADFLDAETSRIDALMGKKRRMIGLIRERARTVEDAVLWSNVDREIPLMHSVQLQRPVMYGIVLPGPDVGGDGIPIVKGGDVAAGLFLDRLARTTAEIERPYARARLRPGDLLFAIRGGVGDAAIVPLELDGANITQDVARVAPAAGVTSEWLLHVLRSRTFQRRAGELVRGATITGLNIRDLERIRIPWADEARQDADLQVLRPLAAVSEGLAHRLKHQIDLLHEHRQALITAAVTGQLDVAKAAA